ncbi:hypothetical protein [Roseococcus pinisoli]|uniref:Lipoprotein n=1 Tax=Roseococcus pinisoli TaxID=2835040 RepID=A0ABS5Q819_9PROT|nr:hypothetical protein [Roseococcus pinisoli]MBS7809543.1 hypothetical protein [Roseococcus pinisoli]
MSRHRKSLLAAALLTCTLAACAPRTITISGAEVQTPTSPARAVTARITAPGAEQPLVEVRLADGTVYAGQLTPADAPPGIGGPDSLAAPTRGAFLVGQLLSPERAPLECRFAILNPARRIDGGGTGYCRGDAGQHVDFVF